jgi:3-oxoadipate enol-lactonase
MSAIILDQGIVHYEVLGRGRPIIFLHGWVGSWRYWIPVMQAVSVSFRAYAIDLWGFGDTSKDPRRYTLDEQLRLLDGFLEELGILRFAVVGHGLGALLGLMYARQNPTIVDRLMAVGYPMEESMINPRMRSDAPAVLADWLLAKMPGNDSARADAPKSDPLAIQTAFSSLASISLTELWRTLATSCLMVHGQNDMAIALPRIDQLVDLPGSMHAVTFDQSGHFPMLDESSKFNRLLIDFLALASGESPRDLLLKEEWKRRIR